MPSKPSPEEVFGCLGEEIATPPPQKKSISTLDDQSHGCQVHRVRNLAEETCQETRCQMGWCDITKMGACDHEPRSHQNNKGFGPRRALQNGINGFQSHFKDVFF